MPIKHDSIEASNCSTKADVVIAAGAAIIAEFCRRKINPDKVTLVSQGKLRQWQFGSRETLAELSMEKGQGIRGIGCYLNDYTAQEIADDLIVTGGRAE